MEESFTPWLLSKSERDLFGTCDDYSDEVLDHMKMDALKDRDNEVRHLVSELERLRKG